MNLDLAKLEEILQNPKAWKVFSDYVFGLAARASDEKEDGCLKCGSFEHSPINCPEIFDVKLCLHCGSTDHVDGDCPDLIKAVENLKASYPSGPQSSFENVSTEYGCKDPDVFGWKTAMKLFAEGVELQEYYGDSYRDLLEEKCQVKFFSVGRYRRKPSPATPDKKEMIARMKGERIFDLWEKGDVFIIEEMCDQYYSTILTPQELLRLGGDLMEMASEKMYKDEIKNTK